MTLEHATHTTYKITRFDSEEWLNYNKKERSKPLKNEPNCLKPGPHGFRAERDGFAAYDLAIFAALLDGCFYFHFLKVLFVSERNSSF